VRRLSYIKLPIPDSFKRWMRSREPWSIEAAALNIGKTHQFIILSKLLFDLGMLDRAAKVFRNLIKTR
jgi:hypothetical protein